MNKKTLKKIAPVALASIMGLSTLGGMAWLTASKVDENHAHTITAGTFSFQIDGGTDKGFKNLNAIPMSDELGKGQTAVGDGSQDTDTVIGNLTVTNNGTVKEAIRLAIAHEGFKSEIPSELVNVYITDKNGGVVYDGTLKAIENADAGFGTIAVLNAGENETYTIKAYIDQDAVNANVYVVDSDADLIAAGKAVGDPKEVNFKLELLSLQADGGISGDTAPQTSYTESQWNTAVGNSSLTRTPVTPRP